MRLIHPTRTVILRDAKRSRKIQKTGRDKSRPYAPTLAFPREWGKRFALSCLFVVNRFSPRALRLRVRPTCRGSRHASLAA